MKIVILDGYVENPGDLSWEPIAALGELTVHDRTPVEDSAEIIARIGDAPLIFTNKTPVTAEIMDACPALRFIGALATGYNVIDVAAAKDRGITVCNVPAYSTEAVAQYTFALLLELCHHVGAHDEGVHAGKWQNSIDFSYWDYPLTELAGKTLGIVGFGHIGRTVARIAEAFGMQVIVHTRTLTQDGLMLAQHMPLDMLCARADIITLHCQLTEENKGMISAERIAKMKDGVMLINTARGPLIDEQALANALNAGKIAAAAVDVVSREPILADNPLLHAKNCIITPHIAWASRECRQRLMDISAENLRAFLDGAAVNVVS